MTNRICSTTKDNEEGCGKVFATNKGKTATCPHCGQKQEVK